MLVLFTGFYVESFSSIPEIELIFIFNGPQVLTEPSEPQSSLRPPRPGAGLRPRGPPGLRGRDVQAAQDLLGRLSQHALHVAHEAVDVAFARRLVDDVLVVVVAQAAAQLLVVHLRLVLTLAPTLGHLQNKTQEDFKIKYRNVGFKRRRRKI